MVDISGIPALDLDAPGVKADAFGAVLRTAFQAGMETATDGAAYVYAENASGEVVRVPVAYVDPRLYGAKADGVTDDTAAFNVAVVAAYATLDGSYTTKRLIFAPGEYAVSSVNLTLKYAYNLDIEADGCVLVANAAGKNVVDCLSSRFITIRGLTVYSAAGVVAASGILIGPKGTETCGNNSFYNVRCLGYYSKAAFWNCGSETTSHFNCRYINSRQTGGEFAYIADGLTQYIPTSDYVTFTRVLGDAVSFTNNHHYTSQFRHEGGGDAVFLSKAVGWTFDSGTYFLSFNGAGVRLYTTSTYRAADLRIHGLFETEQVDTPVAGYTGMKYGIVFDGDGTTVAINGFDIATHSPHCDETFFRNETGSTVRLSNASVKMQGMEQAGAYVFPAASSISFDGTLSIRTAADIQADGLTVFTGVIYVDNFADFSQPADGAYTIYDVVNKAIYIKGRNAAGNPVYLYDGILFFEGAGENAYAKIRAKSDGQIWLGNEKNAEGLIVQATAGATTGVVVSASPSNPVIAPHGVAANPNMVVLGKGTGGGVLQDGSANTRVGVDTTGVGFNGSPPIAKPTITGSRGGNAALESLLTQLASYGLVTDGTTA